MLDNSVVCKAVKKDVYIPLMMMSLTVCEALSATSVFVWRAVAAR